MKGRFARAERNCMSTILPPTHRALALALTGGALGFGCAEDLDLEDPPAPGAIVSAQFDPTNPIPVLQLVPTPTGLVQDPMTGSIPPEEIAPADCEGVTAASCLAFAGFENGWPTFLNPTVIFEDRIDPDSAADNILLLDVTDPMSPTPLQFTVQQNNLTPPPTACEAEFGYEPTAADAFARNVELELIPAGGLQPGRRYVTIVSNGLEAVPADGQTENRPVEASDLFSLLVNGSGLSPSGEILNPPVFATSDGFEVVGLLRVSVEASINAALDQTGLTGAAREAAFEAQFQESAEGLFGLFQFFNALVPVAEGAADLLDATQGDGAGDGFRRRNLVFLNTWSTGVPSSGAPQTALFDPLAEDPVLPFPNNPLLTNEDGDDVLVDLPLDPGASGIEQALILGLSSVNGWSTTSPIVVPLSADIDPATAAGNVLVVPYDSATSMPLGPSHPIQVQSLGGSLLIVPLVPLQQDTFYAVGVRGGDDGIQTPMGETFGSEALFDILKSPMPVITGTTSASADPAVALAFQCNSLVSTGMPLSEAALVGTLLAVEDGMDGLGRSRFQPAFQVFEDAMFGIPRTEMAIAFPYKTQDVTAVNDAITGLVTAPEGTGAGYDDLFPGNADVEPAPLPGVPGGPSILTGQNAQGFICNALCATGILQLPYPDATGMPVSVTPGECAMNPAAAFAHPRCVLSTSNIDRVAHYDVQLYNLRTGNPLGVGGTFSQGTIASPGSERARAYVISGGAAPVGGRPISVYLHGLNQQKENGFLLANSFTGDANGGRAVVLVDFPFQGERASDLIDNATGEACGGGTIDPASVTCEPLPSDTCTNSGPVACDGVRDPSGTGYIGINLFAVRDNFRQSIVDAQTIIDHLRDDEFNGADPMGADAGLQSGANAEINIFGESLGGIIGSSVLAQDPSIGVGAFSVHGGPLTTVLTETVPAFSSALFAALADAGVCTLNTPGDPSSGCVQDAGFIQFLILAQTIGDPGDPLATTVALSTTDNILQQVAIPDPVVPNTSNFRLAAAYGFPFDPTMTPPVSGTEQLQIYDFSMTAGAMPGDGGGCHGFLLNPFVSGGTEVCGANLVDAICNTVGAQLQLSGFINSSGATVSAQQPAAIGPLDLMGGSLPCP